MILKVRMFSGCGKNTSWNREAKLRSDKIDRQLKTSAKESTVKLLLLGTGDSGKSTFVKQMKIIHGDGYSIHELNNFKSVIYSNLISAMVEVIKAMDKLKITLHNITYRVHSSKITSFLISLESLHTEIPPVIAKGMKLLWWDDGFQECFKRAVEYQLSDFAPYYLKNIDKILDPSYIPDEQDMLQSRTQTTQIVETSFRRGNITYRLFDVGGQRSERRKWLHCFDDVKAVLFVVSLSGYDMILVEDGTTNRMEESLNLFQAICVNKFFNNSSIILFLNKLDLFTEKINNTNHHLRLYFSHYNGPDHDVSAAKEFIKNKFSTCNLDRRKIIYPHFTTATNSNNIRIVFNVVLDTILHESLAGDGLC